MNLHLLMKRHGLTARMLAKKLDCHESNVSAWLKGRYTPRLDYIVKLCQILRCSADELLDIESNKCPQLPKALSKELYRTVTRDGKYNSAAIYQMAMRVRKANAGNMTALERWFLEIAQALDKIELVFSDPPQNKKNQPVEQLSLFNPKQGYETSWPERPA